MVVLLSGLEEGAWIHCLCCLFGFGLFVWIFHCLFVWISSVVWILERYPSPTPNKVTQNVTVTYVTTDYYNNRLSDHWSATRVPIFCMRSQLSQTSLPKRKQKNEETKQGIFHRSPVNKSAESS